MFEYSVDEFKSFPDHDGGNVIIQRNWLIEKYSNMVLTKSDSKFKSFCWRAPVGSGKTVFLKLIGNELQLRGCDVYYVVAGNLDRYRLDYFLDLAEEANGKTVVLLVDDVQNNIKSGHWNALLKGSKPANLLVIGVGSPSLGIFPPQFDQMFPGRGEIFPMFFTHDDLPELIAHFGKNVHYSSDVIINVCKILLKFTSGHCFPFVTFMQ